MKRFLLAVVFVMAGCLGGQPAVSDCGSTVEGTPGGNASATFLVDGGVNVSLEVSDTPEERRRGLMGRRSLPRNHGMVFVYEEEAPRSFWMKDTYVPLDMIFIDGEGRVLNVEHASPQPGAADSELRRYGSDGEARYVVEVCRGFANRSGVGEGTRVEFHGLGSVR